MKLTIPNGLHRPLLHVQKASPQLMFATGVVGIVAAGVLACKNTLKLSDVLDKGDELKEAADDHMNGVIPVPANAEPYTEKLYNKDLKVIKIQTAVNVAKLYAVPIGLAAVSIGLLTGSHVVLNKRNAGLTAAYAAADKAFQQYRERVKAELGQEGDDRFRYGTETVEEEVAKKDGTGTKTIKKEVVGPDGISGYARFFDNRLENWTGTPEFNRIFLQAQQNYANDKLHAQGHLFLNEVYDMLGMERSGAGAVVGWVLGKGGDDYIDFGVFNDKTGTGAARDFVNGREGSILLDFNVDGPIFDLI